MVLQAMNDKDDSYCFLLCLRVRLVVCCDHRKDLSFLILFLCSRVNKHKAVCAKQQQSKRKAFDVKKRRLQAMGSEAISFANIAKKTEKHYEKNVQARKVRSRFCVVLSFAVSASLVWYPTLS